MPKKKFVVTVFETWVLDREIEAATADAARRQAEDLYDEDGMWSPTAHGDKSDGGVLQVRDAKEGR